MSLTEGRNTPELAEGGRIVVLPVAAGKTIYDGSMIVLNASGYAQPATKAEGLTSVGRAEEYVVNVLGDDGDATVRVRRGVFIWDNSAVTLNKVTAAHVMKACYIEDDCTVSSSPTGSSVAGKIISVSEEGVAVEMGMAGVDLTYVEAAALLAITGTGVASGDMFDGYVLTDIETDETVIIDGHTYTKAATTTDADNKFADFAGLVSVAATDGIIIIGSSLALIQASKVSA